MVKNERNAFTLIELSVVLAIIALILGAIVVGRDLIRASQLNSVAMEVGRYTQAVSDFRDKYLALPGDFTGAEALWGSDPGGCPNTPYTPTPHTATCNGDGNGQIGMYSTGDAVSNPTEWYRAWQQLADANLIDGTYNGISGTAAGWDSRVGINVPASKLTGAGYMLRYLNFTAPDAFWPTTGNAIELWGNFFSSGYFHAAVTPAEALSIDTKMDDGLPASGNVMAARSAVSPGCTTSDTASFAKYNTANTDVVCGLLFMMGF